MPIYEYECQTCGSIFELMFLVEEKPEEQCLKCGSWVVQKIISHSIFRRGRLESLPDPVPPLRELIGQQREGCEGGFKELENDQRTLNEYKRTKDEYGNSIWTPKEKTYIDMGKDP